MVGFLDKLLWSTVMLGFVAFGLGIIKFGQWLTEPVREMEAAETTDAADVADGEQVEVWGTVSPANEGTIETPLHGTTAVTAVTQVQRRVKSSEPGGGGWTVQHEETREVPFLVQDDTGTVGVMPPEDASPTVAMDWEEFGSGTEPSDPVVSYLADIAGVRASSGLDLGPVSSGARRRCGEGAIEPGEEVRVWGEATETGNGVVLTGSGDDDFVYSTVDQQELAGANRRLRLALYAFGTLWVVVTLFAGLLPWFVE